MIILLHTSKTMRPPAVSPLALSKPELLTKAILLATYLKTLSAGQLASTMGLSTKLASSTHSLIATWTDHADQQRASIDSFLGDIYSGLQVLDWTDQDRQYADQTLRLLSGLYGILRPLDGIYPYRLEMGYKLLSKPFDNLYDYWGESIAETLATEPLILNLAAVEYAKVVTSYVAKRRIITPSFLTINSSSGQPTFVTVHAKIARGALAGWLIKNRISDSSRLIDFDSLGYCYNAVLSTPDRPVFVCQTFAGLGLSVRLK